MTQPLPDTDPDLEPVDPDIVPEAPVSPSTPLPGEDLPPEEAEASAPSS